MAIALLRERGEGVNPLDTLERIIGLHEWVYDRSSDTELTVTATSAWSELHLHFSWIGQPRALQTICAFDARVPDNRRADIHELLALINSQLWAGHFDILPEERFLMFRYVLLLPEDVDVSANQCEELLEIAIRESERFYPAFQFVLWGGRKPADALAAALIETVGEA